MAIELKLFERVESGKGLFAVESISLIYNALTTILILFLYPRMDHPGMMLLERLGIVVLTFVLIYLYQAFPCRLTAFIRMVVQMSLLAYWYPDTFEFNRLFPNLDYVFASAEQAIFHCQPSVEFSKLCPSMWFSEPFNMGYFFYYPMMLIVVVYYFLTRFEWFEKICFVLVTSFFIYYLFYILVPVALILAGMMISSLFSAGTSFVKLVADTQQQLPAITYWLMGSLSSIKDKDVLFLSIPVTLGMVPLLVLRWRMNLLTLGEEEAQSMGVNTRRLRGAVIVCATLLTSASVAVSGMIGWVGLVIPHFCRMLFGYDYRRLIPAGALFGAAFLLAVDDIARLVTTGELPLGILTAFVGAPLFVYLIVTGGGRRVH